ncbi:ATP-binding protein [Halocynthiibacter styelae]|uniref:ATP-binding protein n=1 Tax=Halocynthiibacter styelae TaxID=2761955 RepID=A0A8J7ICF2_9RHOB|nr:ATP-binding protein [Paenihalocynthiibacter styelae]MBI1492689.1 ATP-binding protein [Paenihalocynthiibacter styelae]
MSTASAFLISDDLQIGTVFEVSGSSIKIALDKNITELTRGYKGRVYSVGQLGSIIKLHMGRRLIFATVSLLRLQSDEEAAAIAATTGIASSTMDKRVIEADLLGEAWWQAQSETLDFRRGISTYPLPLQSVYLMTKAETQMLYESVESTRGDGINCHVPIGSYIGASRVPCRANMDKLFGQHCAILGSTGSGKSGTVASILHSVIAHKAVGEQDTRSRIVVIDPHGEYRKAFRGVSTAFKAYDSPHDEEEGTIKLKLPFWLMSSDEFRSLAVGKAEVEATSQANAVYKALTHARMAQAGLILKAEEIDIATLGEHNSPQVPIARTEGTPEEQQKRMDAISSFDRDKPRPFQLDEFLAHITKLQSQRWHQARWQDKTPSELEKMSSILDKIRVLKTDSRIQFLMNDYLGDGLAIADVLKQFISIQGDNETKIRIIDISGLPNEVAGPLAGAIARLLFQYKLNQSRPERERDPILLVCEEAHRYVPNRGDAQYAVAQDAIRRIAREGRKYGLGLMLVSQRPADVEGTVISQCNSWIVLRLSNSQDQQHVSRFLPDSLSNMTSALSSLPRQEALFVGEAAALPARIKISSLREEKLPDSNDISFAKAWSEDAPDNAFLDQICKNMQS